METPNLVPYLVSSDNPCPAIIVTPGGGYANRAPHEGAPIATWLNSIGISAFVLNYRVAPFRFPVPFLDAQRAVRLLRHHAPRFNIDKNRMGMIGFSAGGHLTSLVGALQQRSWFPEEYQPDAIDKETDSITCMILCYPVINMNARAHSGSRMNLLGKQSKPELWQLLSTNTQVSKSTPPTFIWTTRDDQGVPFEHSTMFRDALVQNHVNHELHVFDHGRHGLGLAEDNPDVHKWTTYCKDWLNKQGFC
jgi:acetyl esterase/lipase